MYSIHEIRRKNARLLAESVGGVVAFSDKINKLQSQVSSFIGVRPTKNIGEKVAKQIEQAFNKPNGWLDKDHDFLQVNEKLHFSPETIEHARIYQQLPLDKQKLLSDTAKAFLVSKDGSGQND